MLEEHDIDLPAGWQAAWLDRTLGPLVLYLTAANFAMSLPVIVIALVGIFTLRRGNARVKNEPSKRTEIASKMHKKLLKLMRALFVLSNMYMLHVLVLTLVDTVICAGVVGQDMASEPEAYTNEFLTEIGLYCIYLVVIFAASFFLVPLLQMLIVTWILTRFRNKHGSHALADYIPEARFMSTHIAQIWCMQAFVATGWWSPTSENSLVRYVVLQACIGSALGWLQASFAFNFRADKLEDLNVASGGVREILRLFGKTARIVHTYGSAKEGLPRYQDVVEETPIVDEKH